MPKLIKQEVMEEEDELDEGEDAHVALDVDQPGSTPRTASGQNHSHAHSKKQACRTTMPSNNKKIDTPDCLVKKPRQTPAVTPIPKSHPVVLIPQGRPVIHLPARPSWTTSQVLPAQPQQCTQLTRTAIPATGPSRMPQSSMIPAHEQNAGPSTHTPQSAPTPQLQLPTLFEVNVHVELNQLSFFHKSISAQMVVGHAKGPPNAIEHLTTAITALPPPDEELMDGLEGLGVSGEVAFSRSVGDSAIDEDAGVVMERKVAGIEEHSLDAGPYNEDIMVDWDGGQELQVDSAKHPVMPLANAVAPPLDPQMELNIDQQSTEEPQHH
ncbi:hypothetical protein BKA82DRAFT_4018158 [Pisolithus tinctorius]|nr:hypothetical protein BKA82DRAFT_4018158 [Pisolithus tinctorius]